MRTLSTLFLALLLAVSGCREEVVEELENYGVKREWIPFADQLGFGEDPNYHQQYIVDCYPWFFTQVTSSPFAISLSPEARSGKKALKIVNAGNTDGSLWLARNENLEDLIGKRIKFSAWLKPIDWSGSVEIGCPTSRPKNGGKDIKLENATADLVEGKWSQISYVVDAAPSTEFLMPTLEIKGHGTIYLDDCAIEILGPSTAGSAVRTTPTEHSNLGFENGDHPKADRYKVQDSVVYKLFSWSPSYFSDEYRAILDSSQPHGGKFCGGFTSLTDQAPNDATFYVAIPVEHIQAHRVRFSVWLKSIDLEGVVAYGVSAGGKDHVNNIQRLWEVQGTTDWKQYTAELDIPQDVTYAWLGVGYTGKGKLLVDDLTYERVKQLPFTTGYVDKSMYFAKPLNMDFEAP